VVAKSRLPAASKSLQKRAEASVLYHSKHIITLLEEIQENFEILEAEEKRTEDADVKARIDNERMALQDLVEDLLEKLNDVMKKMA
jgi:gamma-glutamylcysteine synthetase